MNRDKVNLSHTKNSQFLPNDIMVATSEGYKKIEDIKLGDQVLTHKNRYQRVNAIKTQKQSNTVFLKVMGSPINQLPENQSVYVIEKLRVWDSSIRRYTLKYSEPKWIKAKELEKGKHLVGFATDPQLGNPLGITNEEAFLLGRYVADGHIHDGKRAGRKNSYNNKVVFSVGANKLEEFLCNVSTYNIGYTREGNVYKCYLINKRFKDLCYLFGRGAVNKRVDGTILSSKKELQIAFLKGYWSGDGSFNGKEYRATTVSRELAYGIGRLIYNAFQLPYSVYFIERPKTTVIEGRTVNQRDAWDVMFRKEATMRQSVFKYNTLWNPIREIITGVSSGETAYRLSINEDRSYALNNLVVSYE